ncbi:MAG: hypothetical protein JWN98_645 [Abditibacteriota bacterium]|nr:hypothetical protein [Abditibacteriota bacterium]
MELSIDAARQQALDWTSQYGYHAVIPALLFDPAGVPWAWVFLMLLAHEAGKNLWLMFAYGFVILYLVDHVLYALGVCGGRPLVRRLGRRFPGLEENFHAAEKAVQNREAIAVTFGRFLPFVGRWVGIGAGLANVPYLRFALYDALGVGITVFGFGGVASWVGRKTIDSPHFHTLVSGAIIIGCVATVGGIGWSIIKARQAKTMS